ncbi:MAG: hypothetical protein JOY54_13810 [Acidobacteriaceae bacterium]|nr:hypothetical protein [Acidobacteriaceae bacterium]
MIAPAIGLSSTVSVNGVCETASCTVDTLNPNQGNSGTFSYNVNVNGDPYQVYGNYSVSNPAGAPSFIFNASAKYLGTATLAQNDVLNIAFEQKYLVNPANLTGWYYTTASGTLSGNVGAGSNWQVTPTVNGTSLGTVGPYGPGTNSGGVELYFGPGSPTSTPALTGNPVDVALDYTYDFTAGTAPGAGGVGFSPTPEPAETLPAGLAFAGIVFVLLRKRLSARTNNA